MTIDIVVPDALKKTYEKMHFAPAVKYNGLIMCSGVIGTVDGKVPEKAEDEFRAAWQGVQHTLQAAGAALTDILDFTSYHVGMQEHIMAFVQVKDEFLSDPYPAWSAIGTTELAMPNARVEIRVTARQP